MFGNKYTLLTITVSNVKKLKFKTACKDDSGYVAQLKQYKSKKVILLSQHTAIESMC